MNADCIEIKEDNQTETGLFIFLEVPQGDRFQLKIEQGQYSFYLNQTVVEQIQQAKETNLSLEISAKTKFSLWYYGYFNHNLPLDNTENNILKVFYKSFLIIILLDIFQLLLNKNVRDERSLEPGITFNCYYKQDASPLDVYKEEDIILQTTVIFDGDIFHKIQCDFLQNSQYSKIVSAHYWLTEQLLSSFQTYSNLLVWEVASSFTAGFVAYDLYPTNGTLSIFAWVGFTILFVTTRYVLANQFQRLTSMNFKLIDWLAWALVCLIPNLAVANIDGFNDIKTLLLPFLSGVAPKLVEYILRFIEPKVGKLIFSWLIAKAF
ncbi:MAG: hypothetical protein RMX96_21670 [Nostoc sp. ChiSLP02]|nr:hypothetical protein [Nostoc sp. DedSLP05]MDZ8097247.1 hypothetical protein [Nostoc sp. DedSLP01]MDZ8187443.1 hypothetical protein [Nostoc sp. ChiSLP02]